MKRAISKSTSSSIAHASALASAFAVIAFLFIAALLPNAFGFVTSAISVRDSYSPNNDIIVNYTLSSDTGDDFNYTLSVQCPYMLSPLPELNHIALAPGQSLSLSSYFARVDENVEPQSCLATIYVNRMQSSQRGFAISAAPSLQFEELACRDQECTDRRTVFPVSHSASTGLNDIYLDYYSEAALYSVSSVLTYPDNKSIPVTLPFSFSPRIAGIYRLASSYTALGYKPGVAVLEFAVIEKSAEATANEACNPNGVCEGSESYKNCPQDCQPQPRQGAKGTFHTESAGNAFDYGYTESCDDGNTLAGDGCSPACRVEYGWECDKGSEGAYGSCANVIDITPPGIVTNLRAAFAGPDWIYYNWSVPKDEDYNGSVLYGDIGRYGDYGPKRTRENYFLATNLWPGTGILYVLSEDTSGNIDRWHKAKLTVSTSANYSYAVFQNLQNLTHSLGMPLRHSVTAFYPMGIRCYSLNDSRFSISCNGTIINSTVLMPRMYSLNVTANNTYNLTTSATVYVRLVKQRQVLDSHLIVNYDFEDGIVLGILPDGSGYGNNATCSIGKCPIEKTGMNSSISMAFSGTNKLVLNDSMNTSMNMSMNITSGMLKQLCSQGCTIMAWVNISRQAENSIVHRDYGSGSRRFFRFGIDAGNDVVFTIYPNGTSNPSCTQDYSGSDVALNQWEHVAAVYNLTSIALYRNASLLNITPCAYQFNLSAWSQNQPFDIGEGLVNGSLDNLAIYDQPLSAQEIQMAYASSLSGRQFTLPQDTTPPSPVAELKNSSSGTDWIYWIWQNPPEPDFFQNIIFLNGINVLNSSINSFNATGLDSGVQYTIQVFTKDTSGNVNSSAMQATADTLAVTVCTPLLVNTSWIAWANVSCYGNQMNQTSSLTQYDANGCMGNNSANVTFYRYRLVGPLYVNTTWSDWHNVSCLLSNVMNQSSSLTQYDLYSCSQNITYYKYIVLLPCKYDTKFPGPITQLKSRQSGGTWINWEWKNPRDSDFFKCLIFLDGKNVANTTLESYNVTGLECNRSYTLGVITMDNSLNENEAVVKDTQGTQPPNLASTPWLAWQSISECYENDTMLEERSKSQYDLNGCLPSMAVYENRTVRCANPPSSVSGLHYVSSGETWIQWAWENPPEPDFGSTIIFIDGKRRSTLSGENKSYVADVRPGNHTIMILTMDNAGNINYTGMEDTESTVIQPNICGNNITEGLEECDGDACCNGECKLLPRCNMSGCIDADNDGLLDYDEDTCTKGKDKNVQKDINVSMFAPQTDLNITADSLIRPSNVSFYRLGIGRISYLRGIRLIGVDDNGSFVRLNLSSVLRIENARVVIENPGQASGTEAYEGQDSALQDFAENAEVILENITAARPIVKRDGIDCDKSICANASYDAASRTYSFVINEGTAINSSEPVSAGIGVLGVLKALAGSVSKLVTRITGSAVMDYGLGSNGLAAYSVYEIVDQCSDSVQNYDETGVDCGGSCGECITPGQDNDSNPNNNSNPGQENNGSDDETGINESISESPNESTDNMAGSGIAGSGGGSGGGGGGSSSRSSAALRSLSSLCSTGWRCTDWSQCIGGYMRRDCESEKEGCTPVGSMPGLFQKCMNENIIQNASQNISRYKAPYVQPAEKNALSEGETPAAAYAEEPGQVRTEQAGSGSKGRHWITIAILFTLFMAVALGLLSISAIRSRKTRDKSDNAVMIARLGDFILRAHKAGWDDERIESSLIERKWERQLVRKEIEKMRRN